MPNGGARCWGSETPTLEAVAHHAEANTYARLIVALLERGEPMTLAQVAARFEEAGIADEAFRAAIAKRCKPGRAPLYREGNRYHLNQRTTRTSNCLGLPARAAAAEEGRA